MNERIMKLAKEVAAIEGWGPEVWQTTFTEKFAELILLNLISEFDQSMTGEEDSVDYGLHLAKEIIKERFGVE